MKRKRFRIITTLILSLVLMFTVAPTTAFAADDGSINVYVTVKNLTFTQKLFPDGGGDAVKPEWTGTAFNRLKINIPADESFEDGLSNFPSSMFDIQNAGFGNMVVGINGLHQRIGVNAATWGDGSGWKCYLNGKEAQSGIGKMINGTVSEDPSDYETKINDGDEITFYYQIDGKTIDEPYLKTPSSLKNTATYNSVKLNWKGQKSPVDEWSGNTPYNPTTYDVYRATSKNGLYSKIASTKESFVLDNSYVDKTVKTGKTYYYKIKSVKKQNSSEFSTIVTAKPSLSKPAIKKISKKGKKSLKVSWKKVDGASKYQIYRSTKKNGKYKKVKILSSKTTSYTNKKLKKGKKYYYKVRAVVKVDGKNVYSAFSSKKSKRR